MNITKKFLIMIAMVASVTSFHAYASTETATIVDPATVDSSDPDTPNINAQIYGYGGSQVVRTLFKTTVPEGTTHIKVYFYRYGGGGNFGDTVTLAQIPTTDLSTVTWNNQPSIGTTLVTNNLVDDSTWHTFDFDYTESGEKYFIIKCTNETIDNTGCLEYYDYEGVTAPYVEFTIGSSYASSTIDNFIASSTDAFRDTTGFNISGALQWVGENLIKVFLGYMILVIYSLRGWIITILILSAIIYFAYRAFRFYKH